MSLVVEHMCISPMKFEQINLPHELMIFIGYKDNGYRFMHHTQGNVIFCSTQAIFDEGHFPKCPNSHSREKTPPRELTPEIELSASGPFGEDEPAPISFPPASPHPRPLTSPIPPNLPTHSELS